MFTFFPTFFEPKIVHGARCVHGELETRTVKKFSISKLRGRYKMNINTVCLCKISRGLMIDRQTDRQKFFQNKFSNFQKKIAI